MSNQIILTSKQKFNIPDKPFVE